MTDSSSVVVVLEWVLFVPCEDFMVLAGDRFVLQCSAWATGVTCAGLYVLSCGFSCMQSQYNHLPVLLMTQ